MHRITGRRAFLLIVAVLPVALAASAPSLASAGPDLVIASSTYLSGSGTERTEMTVTNLGTGTAATAFPATRPGRGVADAGAYDPATGIWTIPDLSPGATATLRLPGD